MRWAVIALGIASCSHPPPTAAPIAPESPPPSAAVAEADAPAPARASEPGGSAEDEERRYLSLEDVDWKNYTYIPGLCTLRDGYSEYREYSEDFGGLHDTTIWKFVSAATGSSATGTQVAIVLVSEEYSPPNGPGSKRTRVFVYQLIDRK
ncbi:MAG: hypothetical protein KC492_31995, partial [Myxococcales bacterium]|nr:hypothetical protein [Myxococcales bacterium]